MANEKIAKNVGPANLDIAYEEHGDRRNPTVLLVMGLAAQLVSWPLGFVDALVARGLHVVRLDNRDAGRSSRASSAYSLSEMAADAVGLLDVLGIASAHLVGASMGGGIAQTIAVEYPTRARTLTSMMWTTGDPSVGQMSPQTAKAIFGGPRPTNREEHVAATLSRMEIIGSPAYPADLADVAAIAGLSYDRGWDESAIMRQGAAVTASGDRTAKLRALSLPTLVIHGLADSMVDPSGGRATAAAIPGATLVEIEGMGHNLPPGLWERIADHIGALIASGSAAPLRPSSRPA